MESRPWVRWLALGATCIAALACGSSSDPSGAGGDAKASVRPSCTEENPDCSEAATFDEGEQAVKSLGCVGCHQANLAGSVNPIPVKDAAPAVKLYPPNLTNDKDTGIGNWTDEQLAVGIRVGVDDHSEQLCPQMKHFSKMSDFEVYSIIKYLRAIPVVSQKIPRSVCPPFKE